MKEFFKSKIFTGLLIGVGIALVLFVVFQAGVSFGYRRATFAFRLGDNYHKTFGLTSPFNVRRPGSWRGVVGSDLPGGHQAFGKIVRIDLPTIVVASADKVEKTVRLEDKTLIRKFRDEIKPTDLKVGDFVAVIGSPNDEAEISARLVRVLPIPEEKK